ncbi:putative small GTPase superfamily, ARF/SAR type, P-loop containing nucleoside triphosphate hydrolase [Helianthus annuus]|nr:putative small GTPase superfamily, ARF/SAR type, P-loop containing nucleoside triphosphate hydrolase [Helianthus annuus]
MLTHLGKFGHPHQTEAISSFRTPIAHNDAQRHLRSYWRNYFEQIDGLVWVVDSSDLRRLDDCKFELDNLLKEERLSGASLLVFAHKQDIQGALSPDEIAKVSVCKAFRFIFHFLFSFRPFCKAFNELQNTNGQK